MTDGPEYTVSQGATYRIPADPADWDGVHLLITGEPCPECGIARLAAAGDQALLEGLVSHLAQEYGLAAPDDWAEEYDHPVYIHCDRPECTYQAATEWAELKPVLDDWMTGPAPTWMEHLSGAGVPGDADE